MSTQRIFTILFGFFLVMGGLNAQDPVLFTVEGTPVHASEFKYIYTKTNGEKADFSKKSISEYLDLYTRFKLKVAAAKEMKLDTIPSLIQELEGYRRQLSNSYLMDKELTEKLVREAYDRGQEEVNISHLLVAIPKGGDQNAANTALKKCQSLKQQLDKGADWTKLVMENSDDASSKGYGGEIGYFKALQLPNLYELENAAYNTPLGKISDPVKTNLGYHLVKVNDRQAARGEMNAAHILARVTNKSEDAAAKAKIEEIYSRLKKGGSFSEIAKAESDDQKTARKGGEMGFFGINVYEPSIEQAAFSLKEVGDYSKPFRSSLGYHIIMNLGKKETLNYEMARAGLLNRVKRDSRYKITRLAMIDRIKKENNFKLEDNVLNKFANGLDKSFYAADWKAPQADASKTLFRIGEQKVTLGDYVKYLSGNRNLRMRANRGQKPAADAATELFAAYLENKVIKYEEGQLGKKYPEFKALMREYEEGILLFEATKREVWDKAAADTVGLKSFFGENQGKYNWDERAMVSFYTVKINEEKMVNKAIKLAGKKPASSVLAKINKTQEFITVREESLEKGRNKDLDNMPWEAGAVSEMKEKKGTAYFIKIEQLLDPTPKTLKEARGYVVADYQDRLEGEWVERLKAKYKVVVDEKVLKSMIK